MSDIDFKDLVSRKVDDAKWPPPLPAGSYDGVIQSFKFDYAPWTNPDGSKIPACFISIKLTGADASIQDEVGDTDLSKKKCENIYRLTPGEDAPLGDLCRSVLGEDATAGKSWGEVVPELIGKEVLVDLTKDINKKKPEDPPRNNVRKVVGKPA